MIQRNIPLSEVSTWLLQYVHIDWCHSPLCSTAQRNQIWRENCDCTSQRKQGCRVQNSDRLHPCNSEEYGIIVVYLGYSHPDKHLKVNTKKRSNSSNQFLKCDCKTHYHFSSLQNSWRILMHQDAKWE